MTPKDALKSGLRIDIERNMIIMVVLKTILHASLHFFHLLCYFLTDNPDFFTYGPSGSIARNAH